MKEYFSVRLPRLILIAIGFLQTAPSLALAKDSPFWLPMIQSNYRDEATQLETRFTGTGSIVQIGKEYFVLTAGHVSQGKNLTVTINGKNVPIIEGERLADNNHDIELMKIDVSKAETEILPIGVWDKENRVFISPMFPEDSELLDKYKKTKIDVLQTTKYSYVPIPQWIDKKAKKKLKDWKYKKSVTQLANGESFWANSGSVVTNAAGGEIVADVKIAPGMSGAPMMLSDLFGPVSPEIYQGFKERIWGGPTGVYQILVGVSKSFLRDFDHSHFASASEIADVAERFKKGERGRVGKTQWRMRHGLTYRDLGGGTQEILPTGQPAGVGTAVSAGAGGIASAGNGGGTDGGNGSVAPVGNGGGTDGGNGSISPVGNGGGTDGSGGTVARGLITPNGPAASSMEAWDRYKITPGMLYQHEPALAFKVRGQLVMANLTNLEWIRNTQGFTPGKEDVVPPGTELLPYIRRKASIATNQLYRAFNSGCVMDFLNDPATGEPYLKIQLLGYEEGWFSTSAVVVPLELDRYGRVRGSDQFRPIVKTKAPGSDVEYTIDISGLFGIDPAAIQDDNAFHAWKVSNPEKWKPSGHIGRDLEYVPYLILKGDDKRRDSPLKCTVGPKSRDADGEFSATTPASRSIASCGEKKPQNEIPKSVKAVTELAF